MADVSPRHLVQPRNPRYQSLDMWRGVACLAIVVYHSTLTDWVGRPSPTATTGGLSVAGMAMWLAHQLWIGVPLFFVISGYCIAATADAARGGRTSLWIYFVRRFRRIFPPYWVVLIGSALVVGLVDLVVAPGLLSSEPRPQLRPWWFSPAQWLGNVTLTETWRHHVFGETRAHFVGQSWTLCYEEQFYAIVGVLLLLQSRKLFAAALNVTIASLAVQAAALAYGVPIGGFFFDGSWLLFAAGMLVYYTLNYASGARERILVLLLFTLPVWPLLLPEFFVGGSVVGFAFAAGLWLLHPWDRAITNARVLRPLAFCGTICYSLYLVHGLVVRIITKLFYRAGIRGDEWTMLVVLPTAMMASLFCGWLFYLAVERRFLNRPRVAAAQQALRPTLAGQAG